MKRLSIVVVVLLIIIGTVVPATAWKIEQGPCMNIKINMSEEHVKLSAAKMAVLIKTGILDISVIDKDATGLCLITRPKFNPWDLEPEYIVGLIIHTLRIRPLANTVIIGIDGVPLFIFIYNHLDGTLCCKGVSK